MEVDFDKVVQEVFGVRGGATGASGLAFGERTLTFERSSSVCFAFLESFPVLLIDFVALSEGVGFLSEEEDGLGAMPVALAGPLEAGALPVALAGPLEVAPKDEEERRSV